MKTSLQEPSSLDSSLVQLKPDDYIDSHHNHLPEFYSLRRYEYSIFGSIDFVSPYVRHPDKSSLRMSHFQRLLKKVIQQVPGIHRRDFEYFVTDEWSEANEKHLHFIVRKSPRLEASLDAVLHSFRDAWESQVCGGRCVVERYNPALEGVAYVCKRQYGQDGRELEKHRHISKGFLQRMVKDKASSPSEFNQ